MTVAIRKNDLFQKGDFYVKQEAIMQFPKILTHLRLEFVLIYVHKYIILT